MINPLPIFIFGVGVYFMMWRNHGNRGFPIRAGQVRVDRRHAFWVVG